MATERDTITIAIRSDRDVLMMIATYLVANYEGGKKLSGILYLHRISSPTTRGIPIRNIKMFRELCGENTLRNLVILTNMWGEVNTEVGEARELELASSDLFFKPVLDKGAKLLRHTRTVESAYNVLRYLISNEPLPLRIMNDSTEFPTRSPEEELQAQTTKYRYELQQLTEEAREAMRTMEEEHRRVLEMERQNFQEQLQILTSEHNKEKARLKKCLHEMFPAVGTVLDVLFDAH